MIFVNAGQHLFNISIHNYTKQKSKSKFIEKQELLQSNLFHTSDGSKMEANLNGLSEKRAKNQALMVGKSRRGKDGWGSGRN